MKPGQVLVGYPTLRPLQAKEANLKLDRIEDAIRALYRKEMDAYLRHAGPYFNFFLAESLADIQECRLLIRIAVKEHSGSWL